MIRVQNVKAKRLVITGTKIYNDSRVSLFARGIFYTAISMAQRKGFDIKELIDAVPDDKDSVYKGIMELRKHGYVKRVRVGEDIEFRFKEDPEKGHHVRKGNALRVLKKEKNHSSLSENNGISIHENRTDAAPQILTREIEFADWEEIVAPIEADVVQPSFLPQRVKKILSPRNEDIPKVSHRIMCRLCFMAETESDLLLLSSKDRGRVASALGKLQLARADLSQLNKFEDWWNSQWRSKEKVSGAYQPPRPDQVLEHWLVAMKSKTYAPKKTVPSGPKHIEVDLSEVMRNRATTRNK